MKRSPNDDDEEVQSVPRVCQIAFFPHHPHCPHLQRFKMGLLYYNENALKRVYWIVMAFKGVPGSNFSN